MITHRECYYIIILNKVAEIKNELSEKTKTVFDETKTYNDGKWVMFPLVEELIGDYMRLLAIKRKPNRY